MARKFVITLLVLGAALTALVFFRRHPTPLTLTGTVTTNDVLVSPQVTGRLDSLLVAEGDSVASGQLIALLSPEELRGRPDLLYPQRRGARLPGPGQLGQPGRRHGPGQRGRRHPGRCPAHLPARLGADRRDGAEPGGPGPGPDVVPGGPGPRRRGEEAGGRRPELPRHGPAAAGRGLGPGDEGGGAAGIYRGAGAGSGDCGCARRPAGGDRGPRPADPDADQPGRSLDPGRRGGELHRPDPPGRHA